MKGTKRETEKDITKDMIFINDTFLKVLFFCFLTITERERETKCVVKNNKCKSYNSYYLLADTLPLMCW